MIFRENATRLFFNFDDVDGFPSVFNYLIFWFNNFFSYSYIDHEIFLSRNILSNLLSVSFNIIDQIVQCFQKPLIVCQRQTDRGAAGLCQ